MIPPHLFYQIYLSFLEQNDCTPLKCVELSEYTDSAHTEVGDLSSRYMNGSQWWRTNTGCSIHGWQIFPFGRTGDGRVMIFLIYL